MKTRFFLPLLLCCLCGRLTAQSVYTSPFDFPLLLSGGFAELRSSHFHGGVDFKTQGEEGKPIHVVSDGYISRVTVTEGGYGQAMYVTHTDGYMSVYGHLSAFMPAVAKRVEQYQMEHETYTADLSFGPDEFPVGQGTVIALSGNEGYSFGPHLHFEIRRAADDLFVDPLPFFMNRIADRTLPAANAVYVYGQQKQRIPVAQLSVPITAWGDVAFGIEAYDYMDQTQNKYGVYQVCLYQDTTLIFRSVTPQFRPEENPLIDGWIDFDESVTRNHWVMRSHRLPGCPLSMLSAGKRNGWMTIDEERDYPFRYELTDLYGNRQVYRFVVHGVAPAGAQVSVPDNDTADVRTLHWNQYNVLHEPGMDMLLPSGVLFDDVNLHTQVVPDFTALSHTYVLNDEITPLRSPCALSVAVHADPLIAPEKYYLASLRGGKLRYAGGTYAYGWLTANVHTLETYRVAADTLRPVISQINPKQWAAGNIRMRIVDHETAIRSYRVEVDGHFQVFAYNTLRGTLVMRYPERLQRGRPHRLKVSVEDACGNVAEEVYVF